MYISHPLVGLHERYSVLNREREKILRIPNLKQQARWLNPYVYFYRKTNYFPLGVTQFLPDLADLEPAPQFDWHFNGELRHYQMVAMVELCQANSRCGLLVSPTGSGKTICAVYLTYIYRESTLILVKNLQLMKQMQDAFTQFLPDAPVGVWGGGKKDRQAITICTQAGFLHDHKELQDFSVLIVDEADCFFGKKTLDLLIPYECQRMYGFTATPWTNFLEEEDLSLVYGPITRTNYENIVPEITAFHYETKKEYFEDWHERRASLDLDPVRFEEQYKAIRQASQKCRHLLVLFDRVDTVERMAARFPGSGFLVGEVASVERNDRITRFREQGGILLATDQTAGRGFDVPAIDGVMLMFPNKFDSRVQQMCGRALRQVVGKQRPQIYDWVDPGLIYQYNARKKVYAKLWPQVAITDIRVGEKPAGAGSFADLVR